MNNSVQQTNRQSLINIGNWYLGIVVADNGDLFVHIDNSLGVVKTYETDNAHADDAYQWAEVFYVEPQKSVTRNWMKDVTRRIMRVEVQQ